MRRQSLLISKKSIFQYICIYLLMIMNASLIYAIHTKLVTIIVLLVCAYVIFTRFNKIKEYFHIQELFKNDVIVILTMLMTSVFSLGGISLSSTITVILSISIVLAALLIDPKNFVKRYIKLTVCFALVSIVFYILCNSSFVNIFKGIAVSNGMLSSYSNRQSYGGIFYHLLGDNSRNIGIYMEPGVYHIVLNVALFLLLFRCPDMGHKTKVRYAFVLIITVITSMSTAGYCCLLLVLLMFILENKADENIKLRNIIVGVLIFGIVAVLFTNIGQVFESVIVKKITNSSGEFDLSESTGYARIASIVTDWKMLCDNPWGYGVEQYQKRWSSYNTFKLFDKTSTVGIFGFACAFGIFSAIALYLLYFSGMIKNSKTRFEFLTVLLLFIAIICSQPRLYYPAVVVLVTATEHDTSTNNK